MITYSNDSAILSFLVGKLYGCKKLIAEKSAKVQMYSLFFCLLCFGQQELLRNSAVDVRPGQNFVKAYAAIGVE